MLNYAKKAVLFVITAVLGTNLTAFAIRGEWTMDNTWTLLITVVGAIGVYFKSNTVDDPQAKYWIALFVPVLLAIQAAIGDRTFGAEEVAPILLALVGAFQVKAAGNVGDDYDAAWRDDESAYIEPDGWASPESP